MAEIYEIDSSLISGFKPLRPDDGHKKTFGTAVICAGSEYMTGAAVMAAGAALRSGAGLVKVFSEDRTLNAVSCNEPCALLEKRPEPAAALLRKAALLCAKADSVLIGSGMPRDYDGMEALTEVFLEKAGNIVLDAGALPVKPDVLSRFKDRLKERAVPAVITPHIGEFAGLTGLSNGEVLSDAENLAAGFASGNNCVTVLKSAKTIVATPDGKIFINDVPNSGLAKGGSGDVLAGLVAGLLAQGMEPYKAACSAVFIHSMAGQICAGDLGRRAMLPTDLEFYLKDAYLEAGWDSEDE